jgi:hypothetical protein
LITNHKKEQGILARIIREFIIPEALDKLSKEHQG